MVTFINKSRLYSPSARRAYPSQVNQSAPTTNHQSICMEGDDIDIPLDELPPIVDHHHSHLWLLFLVPMRSFVLAVAVAETANGVCDDDYDYDYDDVDEALLEVLS
jgi:hypothetical protein